MKINVTVDLAEFYTESEYGESFSEEIKRYIVFESKRLAFEEFKKEMTEEFFKMIRKEFDEQKEFFVGKVFNELVVDAKIKKSQFATDKDALMSISDWMKIELEKTILSDSKLRDNLNNQTKNSADLISKELKTRYDLLFASQIITKLNENKMLNEDVAKILLG